jgi:hypothetical protein
LRTSSSDAQIRRVDADVMALSFFNLDLHVSVIADLRQIFATFGHRVTDWTLSGHSWVFGRKPDRVDVVNRETWQQLDAGMCAAFYRRYRDELDRFDGFIVTHTPAFALLYLAWNKPILVVNSTRYEQPFTFDPARWGWLDAALRDGVARGQIHVVSNNKGDQTYLREHTGIDSPHLPSLCDYTGTTYRGRRPRFLLHARAAQDWVLPAALSRHLVTAESAFRRWGVRRARYRWQELYDYRGIVHLPYQISTMSICEQYTAGVPLFFPSQPFLLELHREQPARVLSELSFFQISGRRCPHDTLNRTDDPAVLRRWISLADYYDTDNMRFVQYYDSFDHLAHLLETVDVAALAVQLRAFNQTRRERIIAAWATVLDRIAATPAQAAPAASA